MLIYVLPEPLEQEKPRGNKWKQKILTPKTEQGEYDFNLTFQSMKCIVHNFLFH